MSAKHFQRYVNDFAGRYNVRTRDTLDQMGAIARGFTGKRLPLKDLVTSPDVPVPAPMDDIVCFDVTRLIGEGDLCVFNIGNTPHSLLADNSTLFGTATWRGGS